MPTGSLMKALKTGKKVNTDQDKLSQVNIYWDFLKGGNIHLFDTNLDYYNCRKQSETFSGSINLLLLFTTALFSWSSTCLRPYWSINYLLQLWNLCQEYIASVCTLVRDWELSGRLGDVQGRNISNRHLYHQQKSLQNKIIENIQVTWPAIRIPDIIYHLAIVWSFFWQKCVIFLHRKLSKLLPGLIILENLDS